MRLLNLRSGKLLKIIYFNLKLKFFRKLEKIYKSRVSKDIIKTVKKETSNERRIK